VTGTRFYFVLSDAWDKAVGFVLGGLIPVEVDDQWLLAGGTPTSPNANVQLWKRNATG